MSSVEIVKLEVRHINTLTDGVPEIMFISSKNLSTDYFDNEILQ